MVWYQNCGYTAVFLCEGGSHVTFLHSDNETWWPTGRSVELGPGSVFFRPEHHAAVWEP